GNSLLVVEHDPQIMLEADRILDLGPGAGERGGDIVFFGTPREIRRSAHSLTGEYLSGRRRAGAERAVIAGRSGADTSRRPPAALAKSASRAERVRGPAAAVPHGEVVAEARSNRWLELRG
ncbi:excinuclease ABC subunit A, partial [mine drainage metagenome]